MHNCKYHDCKSCDKNEATHPRLLIEGRMSEMRSGVASVSVERLRNQSNNSINYIYSPWGQQGANGLSMSRKVSVISTK